VAGVDAALTLIWDAQRGEVDARVATIMLAASQLGEGTLGDAQRAQAARAAHQLAGSCGTFGYPEASRHAAALEEALAGSLTGSDAARLRELVTALSAALQASP
jgi:HPt (histidine-containing phosphotransfer) domain-containing protein